MSEVTQLVVSPLAGPTQPSAAQCHYCGYEPPDVQHMPRCCPKCGGSAWERYALAGSLLLQGDETEPANIEFRLHCTASTAYLVGNFGPAPSRMIAMTQVDRDDWRVTVALLPGRYFYRFY